MKLTDRSDRTPIRSKQTNDAALRALTGACNVLWTVLFVAACFFTAANSTLNPYTVGHTAQFWVSTGYSVMFMLVLVKALLRLLRDIRVNRMRAILVLAFTAGAGLAAMNLQDASSIGLIIMFAVTADGIPEDRILRTGVIVGIVVIAAAFFLSVTGIIVNNRGNSFGFKYRTHYAGFLFSIMLAYALWKDGRMTWPGEPVMILIAAWMLILKCKTSFVLAACWIVLTTWRHYRAQGGIPFQQKQKYGHVIPLIYKCLYAPAVCVNAVAGGQRTEKARNTVLKAACYAFPICAGLMFTMCFLYRIMERFFGNVQLLRTFLDRLAMGQMTFEQFPIRAFGNKIPMTGSGSTEYIQYMYYVVDSGYVKVLLQYGAVAFLLITGISICLQKRLYGAHRYYALLGIAMLAVQNVTEYQMINLAYSFPLVMAFCTFSAKPGPEACERYTPGTAPLWKRIAAVAAGACLITVCGVWCYTAYSITAWRGWTPDYRATVVVGRDDEKILQAAQSYMSVHDDACCIAGSKEEAKQLTDAGISKDRVFIQERGSTENMLLSAARLIKGKQLPERFTVCDYTLSMRRIFRTADGNGLAISPLGVKPGINYLLILLQEQISMIQEAFDAAGIREGGQGTAPAG